MDYLFAYAVEKGHKEGYASLSEPERWDWHGDIYGWRRVVLGGEVDVRTSPVDPDGRWFDPGRAKLAEDHHRQRLKGGRRRERAAEDTAWQARDVENRWAQDRGFPDFETYKRAKGLDHVDACVEVAKSFIAEMKFPGEEKPHTDARTALRALGVTAREYTPEEMRAGRIALGLEPADEKANGEAA